MITNKPSLSPIENVIEQQTIPLIKYVYGFVVLSWSPEYECYVFKDKWYLKLIVLCKLYSIILVVFDENLVHS